MSSYVEKATLDKLKKDYYDYVKELKDYVRNYYNAAEAIDSVISILKKYYKTSVGISTTNSIASTKFSDSSLDRCVSSAAGVNISYDSSAKEFIG